MDSMIGRLHAAGARYLVIGGQAVRLYGLPRFTMDWDLYIPGRDRGNMDCISSALGEELDTELELLGPRGENVIQTYQTRWGVVQFHLAVPGLPDFAAAESAAREIVDDGSPVRVPSIKDMLAGKLATNRPQDQQDIAFLRELLASNGRT